MNRDYPTISQGLGKFTPDLFARLMRMLEIFEADNGGGALRKPGLDGRGPTLSGRWFVAQIQSSTAIPGESNRFSYGFTEAIGDQFSGSSKNYNFIAGGRGVTDTAYNIMEVNNTSTNMNPGVDLSAGDFPAGMSVQPISNGSRVFMRAFRDNKGAALYLFQAENAIDGSCT